MTKERQTNKVSKKERSEVRKSEAKKRKRVRTIAWGVGSITIAAVMIFIVLANQKEMPGEKTEVMDDQSHISAVNSEHTPYVTNPPTSGPHVENIAQWGVHEEPLPYELLVHNLEDGGVVIYYNDDAKTEDVEQLKNIVSKYPDHVILNSRPELENVVTLTAWGRMDKLSAVDEARIVDFIEAYEGIDHHK